MKRSRIFLGATTAMLAVAGIAAAKMHSFSSNVTRYYCTSVPTSSTQTKCIPYAAANQVFSAGATSLYKVTISGKSYTLYTIQGASGSQLCTFGKHLTACTQPLYYANLQ